MNNHPYEEDPTEEETDCLYRQLKEKKDKILLENTKLKEYIQYFITKLSSGDVIIGLQLTNDIPKGGKLFARKQFIVTEQPLADRIREASSLVIGLEKDITEIP